MLKKNQLEEVAALYSEKYYLDNYRDYTWEALQNEYRQTANRIAEIFKSTTLLDVGCARGYLVKALLEKGVDASGIDASEYATSNPVDGTYGRVRWGFIQDILWPDGVVDTVTAFDILEHIPEEDADRACAELIRVASRLVIINLITLESPDYADPTHITVKPRQWWIDKLLKHGGALVPFEEYGKPYVWWLNVPERSIVIKK